MSTPNLTAPGAHGRRTTAHARHIAARLSALFDADREIVFRLNDAHHRLARANERLWSGVHPDALGRLYDEAARGGHSPIAALNTPAGSGSRTAMLQAIRQTHSQIHRAFIDYQSGCEERRQLAVDVGELSQQLTDSLTASGWSRLAARHVNIHELALGLTS